ncbi:MAG: glycosyltransferase [Bacteroidota bacterium]
MSNKAPDFLILALARWDAPYSSTAFSLAKALSKKRRVFLIDNPFTFKDFIFSFFSPAIKKRRKALVFRHKVVHTSVSKHPQLFLAIPPLMLPINWLPPGSLYDFFARINQRRMSHFLKKLTKEYELQNFHFLNIFNPFFEFNRLKIPQALSNTYYTVDNIQESTYIKKHGPYLEEEYIRKAQLSLATSKYLAEQLENRLGTKISLLPNAADTAFFSQALGVALDKPELYQSWERPPIIYVGAIGFRINFSLLEEVVQAMPTQPFVFIGPKGYAYDPRLESYEHVHFTGPIPQNKLLPYLQYAACGIIPFNINELTAAIYPLKIHEYLAAGLSVVSTPFSEDIMDFGEKIYLTKKHSDFGKFLLKAIQETDSSLKKQRSLDAEKHSWEARAEQLDRLLKPFESG